MPIPRNKLHLAAKILRRISDEDEMWVELVDALAAEQWPPSKDDLNSAEVRLIEHSVAGELVYYVEQMDYQVVERSGNSEIYDKHKTMLHHCTSIDRVTNTVMVCTDLLEDLYESDLSKQEESSGPAEQTG